jgi:hypothetical protein
MDLSVARTFKLNERFGLKLRAEAFNLLNHANFQQNSVNNVQYTTTQECAVTDPNCDNPLPIWDATLNSHFGEPLASAPKIGSRNIQLSARIEF